MRYLKARTSSGNSDVSPVSSSNAHYSTTVPTNACTKLTTCIKTHIFHIRTKPRLSYNSDNGYFDVRVQPKGTFPCSSLKFKNWATLEVQEMGSNPHKSLTNKYKYHICFVSASIDPAGPVRDCEEITLRFEIDSTTAPVDSDNSSSDETVGRSKLE
ncbi:hypothetical protein K457DRAFT_23573 [Linnemannia elongata AG-77]|uniref:Uncharacterized protein n=1 Tax=Linnemannia elongata AG-77 TaxID=1314771 RepID=A0A197JKV5_9FUNG|nr:hypothetical protein K457DRAFT_23573 [Linnemannia elongata AG-77]